MSKENGALSERIIGWAVAIIALLGFFGLRDYREFYEYLKGRGTLYQSDVTYQSNRSDKCALSVICSFERNQNDSSCSYKIDNIVYEKFGPNSLEIECGKHSIIVYKNGYIMENQGINVPSGSNAVLPIKLFDFSFSGRENRLKYIEEIEFKNTLDHFRTIFQNLLFIIITYMIVIFLIKFRRSVKKNMGSLKSAQVYKVLRNLAFSVAIEFLLLLIGHFLIKYWPWNVMFLAIVLLLIIFIAILMLFDYQSVLASWNLEDNTIRGRTPSR